MEAAVSAAHADGVAPPPGAKKRSESSCGRSSYGNDGGLGPQDVPSTIKDEDGVGGTPPSVSTKKEECAGEDSNSSNNNFDGTSLSHMLSGKPPNRVTSSTMKGAVDDPSDQSESPVALRTASETRANDSNRRRAPLRRGKWTPEEEAYAGRLIQEFKAGLLPLTDGTTLRTFLSKLLNCDPMRISKKFVGANCIGKQVFRRRGADVTNLDPEQIQKTRLELSELEKKFLDRVAQNKGKPPAGGAGGRSAASGGSGEKRSSGTEGLNMAALGGMSNINKSAAAAAGRALLQGNNKAPQAKSGEGNTSGVGLLAQLQANQPGMFDSSTARNFLNAESAQPLAVSGGLGEGVYVIVFSSLSSPIEMIKSMLLRTMCVHLIYLIFYSHVVQQQEIPTHPLITSCFKRACPASRLINSPKPRDGAPPLPLRICSASSTLLMD